MPSSPPPDKPPPNPVAVRKVEQFVEAFERAAESNEALLELIGDKDNGLICAIDDLIDEIRGLREDLRVVAKQGAVKIDLGSLLR